MKGDFVASDDLFPLIINYKSQFPSPKFLIIDTI